PPLALVVGVARVLLVGQAKQRCSGAMATDLPLAQRLLGMGGGLLAALGEGSIPQALLPLAIPLGSRLLRPLLLLAGLRLGLTGGFLFGGTGCRASLELGLQPTLSLL